MRNKSYFNLRNILVGIGIVIVSSICAFVTYIMLVIAVTPSKETTLEKIQTRIPFALCRPTYLPENITLEPEIQADLSDPVEVEIRILYRDFEEKNTVIEIVQTHIPNKAVPDFLGDDREPSVRALIAWVVGWPNVDAFRDKTDVNALSYQEENLEYGLFEITSSDSVKANMVAWKKYPVFFQVFTRLSPFEAKKIVHSLTDCWETPGKSP